MLIVEVSSRDHLWVIPRINKTRVDLLGAGIKKSVFKWLQVYFLPHPWSPLHHFNSDCNSIVRIKMCRVTKGTMEAGWLEEAQNHYNIFWYVSILKIWRKVERLLQLLEFDDVIRFTRSKRRLYCFDRVRDSFRSWVVCRL